MSAALDISHEAEILPPGGFDYGALPADVAVLAREAVATFNAVHRQLARDVIALGDALIRVKDRLEHGQFESWLAVEFGGFSARTARNYMQLARNLGTKAEIISDLPLSVAYKLAAPSVPETVRAAVVRHIEVEPKAATASVVAQMLDDELEADRRRKAAEREEARRTKLSEAERKTEDTKAKARERYEKDKQRKQDAEDRERHERDLQMMRAARLIAEAVGPARDAIVSQLMDIEAHSSTRWLLMALDAPHPNSGFLDKTLRSALEELKASGPALPEGMGFDLIKHAWKNCSAQEKAHFVAWVKEGEA